MFFALMLATVQRDSIAPETDEHELVRRVLAGDRVSFDLLYRRHIDRVFGLLTRILGPIEAREDLAQQVFYRLYRSLAAFRGDSKLSTYVYRITVRVVSDYFRRSKRHQAYSLDESQLEALVAPGPSPHERSKQRQELREAFALLATIKPKKRVAFVLVAVEGLSHAEAATIVGASAAAVKQRVLHARRELLQKRDRRRGKEAS